MDSHTIPRKAVVPSKGESDYMTIHNDARSDPLVAASSTDRDCSPCGSRQDEHGDMTAETETTSTEENQQSQSSHTRERTYLCHLKAWWPEIGWCFGAVALFVGLIVFLQQYDEKEPPKWPDNIAISVNTIVAIIATVCRAMTVIPVAEGISQLKWNSFARGQRPLEDLFVFDQASRGPWGSMMLLLKTRGKLLGVSTLAAVILISGLAMSSLTQATISLVDPPEAISKDAVAQKAINDPSLYSKPEESVKRSTTDLLAQTTYSTILMREKTRRALLQKQIEPDCPVGDCRWEPFYSLGICTVTKNITSKLTIEPIDLEEEFDDWIGELGISRLAGEEVYNITLGANTTRPFSVYDQEVDGISFATDWRAQRRFEESDDEEEEYSKAVLARQDIIYKPSSSVYPDLYDDDEIYKGPGRPWQAMQWVLHWCVYEYEVSVDAGVPRTEVVQTSLNFKDTNESNILTITGANETEEFAFVPEILWLKELQNGTHLQDYSFLVGAMMNRAFSDTSASDRTNGCLGSLEEAKRAGGTCSSGLDCGVSILFHPMRTSWAMIMNRFSLRLNEIHEDSGVLGRARVGNLVVVIRWPWLSLLAAQIVLTISFLIYVMVDTADTGVEIVKSSNIADLLAIKTEKDVLEDSGIAAKVQRDLRGRLVREDGRWNIDVYVEDAAGEKGSRHRA